jgi:hypothetical protein
MRLLQNYNVAVAEAEGVCGNLVESGFEAFPTT